MQQDLRVDSGGLQTMATRWGAAAGELNATAAPTGRVCRVKPALSRSTAPTPMSRRSRRRSPPLAICRAAHVVEADTRYVANETDSANMLAAVASPVIRA
ncbi:hypothetical protein I547_5878 [Mycobacterium kansasii 824]|uniref:Uncharacterized protein n=2 Tax=Mycobacterium kansasii TaxID=1768 RepID=A0A1V3X6Q4_MYCKA|nr:hypothetical protein I547_5878 [Mycobacterium kansasii 824]OOK74923.1 hypothetical protein BZL29_4136 [Mycobacterium kansasii]